MSTGDTVEVVNVIPNHVVALASDGALARSADLRASTIARADLERLAKRHVLPA